MPPPPPDVYKSDFWSDFVELHYTMIVKNNDLVPKYDSVNSWPHQWPFATVGIRMTDWEDKDRKYYLVGNPFVWWGVALSVGIYLILFMKKLLRRRSVKASPLGSFANLDEDQSSFLYAGQVALGGWFLHYIPFFFMKRTLYLHHYLPALYFGILLFALMVDRITSRSSWKTAVFFILGIVAMGIFIYFNDFVYGFTGPVFPKYKSHRWFSTWNFYMDEELKEFLANPGGASVLASHHQGP